MGSFGVCCSSWVVTSRGSTGRSFLVPMGNPEHGKVADANCMVGRIPLPQTNPVVLFAKLHRFEFPRHWLEVPSGFPRLLTMFGASYPLKKDLFFKCHGVLIGFELSIGLR